MPIKYAERKKCKSLDIYLIDAESNAKTPETPIKTPLVMDKDAFIEKRIIEGDTPEQAMEEWLLVEKRRGNL